MKLKYGNIPKGRFGSDDGIVNVCLNKRFALLSNRICMVERIAQQVIEAHRKNDEQTAYSRNHSK